jgi:hypothetical protein
MMVSMVIPSSSIGSLRCNEAACCAYRRLSNFNGYRIDGWRADSVGDLREGLLWAVGIVLMSARKMALTDSDVGSCQPAPQSDWGEPWCNQGCTLDAVHQRRLVQFWVLRLSS